MPRESAGVRSARYRAHGPQARTLFLQMNLPDELREEFGFLSQIKSRDDFADLVRLEYPLESESYRLIMRALDLAKKEHWERRRHSGEREFKHLFRCALILWIYCGVRSPDRIAAMFLHDLAETFRKKWTPVRIYELFGAEVEMHVWLLTKEAARRGVSKRENERHYYMKQLAIAPRDVVEEKGVDALDNLMTLWKRSIKRVGRKIDDVIRFVLPLLHKHNLRRLIRAVQEVLAYIRHKLHSGIAFAH